MCGLARRDQDPGRTVVSVVILAALGVDVGLDPAGNGRNGTPRLMLVDHRRTFAVVAVRAIRSLSPAPVAAANVFPVCLRSCKCRPGAPIAALA
jgi:hypothetical protein